MMPGTETIDEILLTCKSIESRLKTIESFIDTFHKRTKGEATYKGWYVTKAGKKFEAWIGPTFKEATYIGRFETRKEAVAYAIKHAKKHFYFDERATIEWLKRKGYDDLVEQAKKDGE